MHFSVSLGCPNKYTRITKLGSQKDSGRIEMHRLYPFGTDFVNENYRMEQ